VPTAAYSLNWRICEVFGKNKKTVEKDNKKL
jgi:hypothetical protein